MAFLSSCSLYISSSDSIDDKYKVGKNVSSSESCINVSDTLLMKAITSQVERLEVWQLGKSKQCYLTLAQHASLRGVTDRRSSLIQGDNWTALDCYCK